MRGSAHCTVRESTRNTRASAVVGSNLPGAILAAILTGAGGAGGTGAGGKGVI